MEQIAVFCSWLSDKEFAVPLGEVILLLIFNSFCLLYGKYKLGLLISYCFVFYWGFVFNRPYLMDVMGRWSWGLPVYILLGLVMLVVIILRFFHDD